MMSKQGITELIVMFVVYFKMSQSSHSQFELLEITLPAKSVDYWMDFGVGEYNDNLITVDSTSYSVSSELNIGDIWTENDNINIPFNGDLLRFYSQSSVESNNILYGVPWIRSPSPGGFTYHSGSTLVQYDFINDGYMDINTYDYMLPTPTKSSCVAMIDDILYIIGGYVIEGYPYPAIKTVQSYDIISNIWSSKSDINIARGNYGCSSNGENIYIFGGSSSQYADSIVLDSIEKYAVNTDEWTILHKTLNTARYGHKCMSTEYNGFIYCIGGQYNSDPYDYLSSVEVFDPSNGIILENDITLNLNIPRTSFGMTLISNYLIVLGGHGVDEQEGGGTSYMLDSIERLDISTPAPVTTTSPPVPCCESVERIPCNASTDITKLGNILCHYSSVHGDGYNSNTNTWADMSAYGNDMDSTNMVDITGVYLGAPFWVQNENNGDGYGYIIFPEECNLPSYGYTLFTASMHYGANPVGSRAFGNCNDNSFVSGWYEPKIPEESQDQNVYVRRPRGPYSYTLAHDRYVTDGLSRWVIASDTMNSFRINGAEITHNIRMINTLGNDVQICFNYVDGSSTNGAYRIKEYIVFDEELNNENRRCVEEYIFDRNPVLQMLEGLAPFQSY